VTSAAIIYLTNLPMAAHPANDANRAYLKKLPILALILRISSY